MIAHILEFRLFVDEPGIILRAQRDLLRENLRMLKVLARPIAILAIPSLVVFFLLDGFFGYAPLERGRPVVFTAELRAGNLPYSPPCADTPGIRIPRLNQVSWRVMPQPRCEGGRWKFRRTYFLNSPVKWLDVPYPVSRALGRPWWMLSFAGWMAGGLVYWRVNG